MTSASSTTIVRSFLRDAFTRLRVHAKTALFRAEQAMLSDERRRCVALIAQQVPPFGRYIYIYIYFNTH